MRNQSVGGVPAAETGELSHELVSLVDAMAAAPIAPTLNAMDLVEARIDPPPAPRLPRLPRVGAPVAHPAIAATVIQAEGVRRRIWNVAMTGGTVGLGVTRTHVVGGAI